MNVRTGWEGRYYEDFEVGDLYRHPLGRTITDTDNAWSTLLAMNTNQMHFNDRYAGQSSFGRALVNSPLTLAIITGLSVADISQNAMANLGWDEVRMPHPVFVGDTLYAESLVLDKRESASRPHAGIVRFKTRGLNQDGAVVMHYQRTVYVYKRDAPQDKDHFPEAQTPWEDL